MHSGLCESLQIVKKQQHVTVTDNLLQMDGDGNFDGLSGMGFSVLHNFEEVSCDAATWTKIPPS